MIKDSLCGSLEKVGQAMFVCRMYVCANIFTSGARSAGPIGTGKYWFDAPEQRKDDGVICKPIGCTWLVPGGAIAQTLAKNLSARVQAKRMDGIDSNLVGQ